MNQPNKRKIFRMTIIGLLTAIIIIQTFIPFLGYIPVGPLSLTIIPITVIIVAITLGPLDGAIVGGVWGLITFIRAFVSPTSPLAPILFTNPLISVLPRILIGVVTGYVYLYLRKTRVGNRGAMRVAALLGSLTNTFLVLGFAYLFYKEPYANALNMDVSEVLPAILYIVATNGIAEAVLALLVVPIIAKPLLKFNKK